jgi:hypothetical protein
MDRHLARIRGGDAPVRDSDARSDDAPPGEASKGSDVEDAESAEDTDQVSVEGPEDEPQPERAAENTAPAPTVQSEPDDNTERETIT